MSDEQIKKFFEPGSYEEIPHDNMRKTIARRLAASMQTTPHFYLTVDCDLDALLALREQLNAAAPKDKDGKPGFKLSVNDFMIKAHALALMRVPAANVSWTEGSLLRHKHVDIGVAVAIPEGLITPIVRKADQQSLSSISNAMKDFGARAKARKLKPDEYQGGSTALSNLGMFGIKQFTAIINPPHSTILAVGAGEKRVVVRNDQPAVATVMSATLSCDHRAIDGALGAHLSAGRRRRIARGGRACWGDPLPDPSRARCWSRRRGGSRLCSAANRTAKPGASGPLPSPRTGWRSSRPASSPWRMHSRPTRASCR
jgi:pyruvate dehydrogenase E2 component (dihydrolipoamide acetyltransferase)